MASISKDGSGNVRILFMASDGKRKAVRLGAVPRKVAEAVASGEADQGVLFCWTGTGTSMAANKVPGVRAAVAWSEETARLARQHNDANVLAIGARTTPPDDIPKIVRAWFSSDFEGGRHGDRVRKIEG